MLILTDDPVAQEGVGVAERWSRPPKCCERGRAQEHREIVRADASAPKPVAPEDAETP